MATKILKINMRGNEFTFTFDYARFVEHQTSTNFNGWEGVPVDLSEETTQETVTVEVAGNKFKDNCLFFHSVNEAQFKRGDADTLAVASKARELNCNWIAYVGGAWILANDSQKETILLAQKEAIKEGTSNEVKAKDEAKQQEEIRQAKEVIAKGNRYLKNHDRLMSDYEVAQWQYNYNQIANEGGEGYVPDPFVSQSEYTRAQKLLDEMGR